MAETQKAAGTRESAEMPVTNGASYETSAIVTAAPLPPVPTAADAEPVPPMLMRAVFPFGLSRRDWRRALGLGAALVVAVLFLWQVQAILPPFLIAFALAALLDPTLRYLEQHGHSRVRAILTLYLLGFLLVVLFVALVVPTVRNQVEDISGNLSTYYANMQKTADSWMQANESKLRLLNIKQSKLNDLITQKSGPVQTSINATLGTVSGFLQGIASKILWLIIIPVATFFFMRDYPLLRARIIALFPTVYHERIDSVSREIVDLFSAYLRGLAKVCALYAVVATMLFWILGLRYCLFLGLMAGAFYAVPYVGQLFTAIGAGVLAYMESHTVGFMIYHVPPNSLGYTLVVIFCAILAQNLFDQIVYPRVVGASVGLHPVVSIFALMSGATMFGVWGMLIAVPVAASIQLMLVYAFPKLCKPPPARLLETPPPLA